MSALIRLTSGPINARDQKCHDRTTKNHRRPAFLELHRCYTAQRPDEPQRPKNLGWEKTSDDLKSMLLI